MELEYLEAILRRHQQEKSIHRVLWIKSEPAVPSGQNFLSSVTRVKAGVILGSGAKSIVNVVVKDALDSEAGKWTIKFGLFLCEIKMFTNILTKMTDLMCEFGDKREQLWADLIAHGPRMIVFEDLKEANYKLDNPLECLDLIHSKLVISSMARFHAMSRILLQRNRISPSDVQPYALLADEDHANKIWGNGLKVLSNEMKAWGPEWTNIRERLLKSSDTIAERLVNLSKTIDSNKFNVINHGDIWISNLMFKYDYYNNIPISVRFVDFQLSHYQSLGWDLTYFLHTSLHGDVRRKYFDELVNLYLTTLNETLLMYNYPKHELPSLDDIYKDLASLNLYSLVICMLTHTIMTNPLEDRYSLSEALKPEIYKNCGYNLEVFRGTYKDELGPDLRKFAELGVI